MHLKRPLQKLSRSLKALAGKPTYAKAINWPETAKGMDVSTFNFTVDFELFWSNGRTGDNDLPMQRRIDSAAAQAENFEPFLELLEDLKLSISWAAAGILANHQVPSVQNRFSPNWSASGWYDVPAPIASSTQLWNGRDYLEKIKSMKTRQEILSHGFAHIDYSDPSTSAQIAQTDLELAHEELSDLGLDLQGFVFPCNQVGHQDLVEKMGYKIIRGSDNDWHVGKNSVRTPVGFWISPGVMDWSELRSALDTAIAKKSYIHPWMHLNECSLTSKDLDKFYRPLFEYVLEKQAAGDLKTMSYKDLKTHFFSASTAE